MFKAGTAGVAGVTVAGAAASVLLGAAAAAVWPQASVDGAVGVAAETPAVYEGNSILTIDK